MHLPESAFLARITEHCSEQTAGSQRGAHLRRFPKAPIPFE
jgi:hypothetical protein